MKNLLPATSAVSARAADAMPAQCGPHLRSRRGSAWLHGHVNIRDRAAKLH